MKTPARTSGLLVALAMAGLGACGNSSKVEPSDGTQDSGGGSSGGDSGGPVFGGVTPRDDFREPVLDVDAPRSAPDLFNAADVPGEGPCLTSPEMGSLFPANWLRPRFELAAPAPANLFEITVSAPNQVSPLRIYTRNARYTLSAAAWQSITQVASGAGPLRVRIRSAAVDAAGTRFGGPWLGSEGTMEIAPVIATGSIIYWTTSNGTVLKGFRLGDETVNTVLTPANAESKCVGCHTSTPDGVFTAVSSSQDASNGGIASVDVRAVEGAARPAFITPAALALLGRTSQFAPSYSAAHWTPGDRFGLSMRDVAGKTEILWTNLEATSEAQGEGWGVLPRGEDPGAAAGAVFSHDGSKVVYTAAPVVSSGTVTSGGDIRIVPYANRAGGKSVAVAGASDPAFHEFYPSFSADDALLAFNRVPQNPSFPPETIDLDASRNPNTSYNNPAAEVFVVPSAGGTATRLAANDPPACVKRTSPGLTNSWPKWSPEVKTAGTTKYYFLVFSSIRRGRERAPQLYVAPVLVDGAGAVRTYPALYLWNQPEDENNHTPAWDVFKLPAPK